jgi:tetratricopeptide (TPR) repeat protein
MDHIGIQEDLSVKVGAQKAQTWKHLSSEKVRRVRETLDAWRVAVECHTKQLFRDTNARRTCWKRTYNPAFTLKPLNWEHNIQKIAQWISEDWNSESKPADENLTLTSDDILRWRTPPEIGMRPRDAADLQQPPQIIQASRDHLISYLSDLTKAIAQAQTTHVTAERSLRETRATIFESLGLWDMAERELKQLTRCNAVLGDHVYAVRAMLRRGVALYRLYHFTEARNEFADAVKVMREKLPANADLRTEISVWDYLGLCWVRLGESEKALNEVYFHRDHQRRIRLLSTPLGDASRLIRIGIAYLELDKFREAKAAFLSGVKKRVSVAAWPEAARALRYVGHWYFRKKNYEAALTVWEIALKRQRAVGDDIEEARLLYQRGEAFRQLADLARKDPRAWHRVCCGVTAKIFPDVQELSLLRDIQGPYQDVFDFYPISRTKFSGFAYASYHQSLALAKTRDLSGVIADSEAALSLLAVE